MVFSCGYEAAEGGPEAGCGAGEERAEFEEWNAEWDGEAVDGGVGGVGGRWGGVFSWEDGERGEGECYWWRKYVGWECGWAVFVARVGWLGGSIYVLSCVVGLGGSCSVLDRCTFRHICLG